MSVHALSACSAGMRQAFGLLVWQSIGRALRFLRPLSVWLSLWSVCSEAYSEIFNTSSGVIEAKDVCCSRHGRHTCRFVCQQ